MESDERKVTKPDQNLLVSLATSQYRRVSLSCSEVSIDYDRAIQIREKMEALWCI